MSIADCQTATGTTGACVLDMTTCATGQAGPTAFNYIHKIEAPSLSTGEPTGAGILCFANETTCEASNNNACGPSPALTQCSSDFEYCTTGQAGPLPTATYTCKTSYPPGSLPNGGGQLCYNSYANCVYGPNACGDNAPCVLDVTTCSTGVAGPTTNNYFCPLDTPTNSLPNGGGQACYSTSSDCLNGPNYCTSPSNCVTNYPTCSTGVAGPTPMNTFCVFDQPLTLWNTPTTPGSLPDAAGTNCYFSQQDCLNGPNPCTGQTECTADYTICSTGQAGPTAAWYFCAKDSPVGSLPDGGGELCYNTPGNCFNGPNPCGINSPCALDYTVCSTGEAGPNPYNWFCELDTPIGQQSNNAALPSGSGLLCWDSTTDCLDGPNACAATSDCATNKICSTGEAAANAVGNNYICLKDVPTGAAANAAGKWCYDTAAHCADGTNACNASSPCSTTPLAGATVCATAPSGYTYYCAFDYPFDSGLSTAGNLCYKASLECMDGPNACNTSFLCTVDAAKTGACAGSMYTWYCPISVPGMGGAANSSNLNVGMTSTPIPTKSFAAATAVSKATAAVLAGAALVLGRFLPVPC